MSKKIKICYVTSIDTTLRFIFLRQMKFLQQQGYEVHAACAPGKWVKEIEAEGIRVKPIGFKRKMSPFSDIISFLKLYQYFKREKFHAVCVSTLKAEFFAQIAARLADVPVVCNVLNGLDFTPATHPAKKRLIVALQNLASRCSDLVFTISRKIHQEAIDEGLCNPALLRYMGWGIDTNRFNSHRFPAEFLARKKTQLGIPADANVIGIVARMVAEKGYLELFEAFKKVALSFPKAVILAVGPEEPEKSDSITEETFKRYGISDKVIWLKERTDVDEIYPLMDIFVLPTHREGLGVSVLEASAMEKPVITTPIVADPEVIENGKTGVLVPVKNVEALASTIIDLLSNPQKAKDMGQAGREKVVGEFSESVAFSLMEAEIAKLLRERVVQPAVQRIKVCCVVSVDMTLRFMLFGQLKYLQSQGYEVHAVSSPGKWIGAIEAQGIKVAPIGFKRKTAIISDLISCFKLYRYFKREKFHVVHTHSLKAELFGQLAAKLADVPIIINTIHGFYFGDATPLLKRWFFMQWDRVSCMLSDMVMSISKEIIRFCLAHHISPKKKLAYLGRDIDTERFNRARFSDEFIAQKKSQLGVKPGQKVVGIVARMVAEKGFLELFEAFKKVLVVIPEAVLMVVGGEEPTKKDGLTKKDAERFGIAANTLFLGERADTEELYPLMDIFVLPTHREGLGAVILEASSMEVPIISTHTGGVPEAVEDGVTGVLIGIKNSDQLAEAIIDLLSNPQKAKEMGNAGRKKILREFSEQIVFDRLGRYYADLVNAKIRKE